MFRTVLMYGVGLIAVLVGIEAFSAAIVYILATTRNIRRLRIQLGYFHPLVNLKFRQSRQQGGFGGLDRPAHRGNPITFNPHTGFDLAPNTSLLTAAGSGTLRIGPDGFVCNATCEPLTRAKPEGEFRAFLMGGSAVMGTNDGADSISGYLERLLRADRKFAGRTVRVVNAGVGGFFAPQQLVKLHHQVLTYEPDMVIWLGGHNDHLQWQSDMFYKPQLPELKGRLVPNAHYYEYSLIASVNRVRSVSGAFLHFANLAVDQYPVFYYTAVLARYIRRVFILGGTANPKYVPDKPLAPDQIQERLYAREINSIRYFMGAVDSAAGMLRARGIRGLFCLEPHFFVEPKSAIAKEEAAIVQTKSEFAYIDEYYGAARAEFARRRAASDAANDRQIRFCDLTPIFRDESTHIFTDQIHLTPRGNSLIAETLFREVMAQIR